MAGFYFYRLKYGRVNMELLKAFGLVALGMIVAHTYNWMAWRKYYEGRAEYRAMRKNSEQ